MNMEADPSNLRNYSMATYTLFPSSRHYFYFALTSDGSHTHQLLCLNLSLSQEFSRVFEGYSIEHNGYDESHNRAYGNCDRELNFR
jgi:hypothetical protein